MRAAIARGHYDVQDRYGGDRPSFAGALRNGSPPRIVAELKPASPTEGRMRVAFDAGVLAAGFAESGASALSVLTEADEFGGSLANVRAATGRGLPVLMKDFVLGGRQIAAGAAAGASAVLLLQVLADKGALGAGIDDLVRTAHDLGLEVVLEAGNEREFAAALGSKADVLGLNNRDLRTLKVDPGLVPRVLRERPADRPVLAMSGVAGREDVRRLVGAGADAVLVGTSLMRADDPFAKVRELRA